MATVIRMYVVEKDGAYFSGGERGRFFGPDFKPQFYKHPGQILGMFTNCRGSFWKKDLADRLRGSRVVPVDVVTTGEGVPIEEVIDALKA